MSTAFTLQQLGWRPFHSQQLTFEELATHFPARIVGVHRSGIHALAEHGEIDLAAPRDMPREGVAAVLTAGDWVLVERRAPRIRRRLDRFSAIVRTAAGRGRQAQAIAANLDAPVH